MPQLHFVKKARKDILTWEGEEKLKKKKKLTDADFQVRRGQSYYWWQFAYSSKQVSLTRPKQSQLTRSGFWSAVYDLQDEISNASASEQSDLESLRDGWVDTIRDLASEQEEKRSNMPDHLQDVGSGETLQNRADSLEEWAGELEGVDVDIDDEEIEAEARQELDLEDIDGSPDSLTELIATKTEEKISEILEELQNCSYNGE